jgi:hypothetical protein
MAGKTVVSIAAGADHNLALCSDGTLVAWGRNDFGQIGNNLAGNLSSPGRVETSSGALMGKTVISLAAGTNHSLVLLSDGSLAAWGSNAHGQLGTIGSNGSFVPIAVARNIGALFGRTVTKIGCGEFHSMVLSSDGDLASWGEGVSGQLGNNTLISSDIPESVTTAGALSSKSVWNIASGGASSFVIAALPAITLPAALHNLVLAEAELTPIFDSEIKSYQASVPNGVPALTLGAVAENPTAQLKINGVSAGFDQATESIPLSEGSNLITVEVIAQDGSSSALYTVTVIREVSSYTNWQDEVFTLEEQADPTMSGEQASPAGDGISNLMKYAMKLDPKSNGVANLPRSSAQNGYLNLTYRRNKLASDLTYTVQVTSDLTSAEWQDAGVVISQSDEGEYSMVTVRDIQPMHNQSKRFMRLKVSK